MKYALLLTAVLFICSCESDNTESFPRLDLASNQNGQFTFTNKQAGFYYSNSHHENVSGHQGWTVDEFHYLRDYRLLINHKPVLRDSIRVFNYWPFGFNREYKERITESFTMLDSLNAIVIELESAYDLANLSFELITHTPTAGKNLKISAIRPSLTISPKELEGDENTLWLGARLAVELADRVVVVIALEKSETALETLMADILAHYPAFIQKRKSRIETLIANNNLMTSDPGISDAVSWAQLSLDALVTRQRGNGIWAGLPWFNNYWGRDTFISFAGALLVNGQFDQAKTILTDFARFQLKDENVPWSGRIPNRVTNKEVIYNTADGTWWFIREIWEYLLYSGDREFAKEIFPVVERAINGALKYRTDDFYFLKHDDADTWMDAKGPNGAWSPRGNRAVEIQALWYTALQIGSRLAVLNNRNDSAEQWQSVARELRTNFQRKYINKRHLSLFDHLNSDGSKDKQLRPNQIFAVSIPALPGIEELIDTEMKAKVTSTVASKLTYRYGVASLWQEDDNFHPWHHYEPYYVQDEAYHNGTVWTWLAGPLISALMQNNRSELAYQLFANETHQILYNDAIGNYSELLDALPRPGKSEPDISGTVSQAWSLAEFARNFYQDFIGFHPDMLNKRIILKPQIPLDISAVHSRLPFSQNALLFEFERSEQELEINVSAESAPKDSILVLLSVPGFDPHSFTLPGPDYVAQVKFPLDRQRSFLKDNALDWYFAIPTLRDSLPALHGPDFELLTPEECYLPEQLGKPVIQAEDPLGDDHGKEGNYSYPQNSYFKPGIFDLQKVSITDEGESWGFSVKMAQLVNPNWHPAYGFQLSFLAMAIRQNSNLVSGTVDINRNAQLRLESDRAFDHIIYLGGGFEIADQSGKILARYTPVTEQKPLGDTETGIISFKIPKRFLPALNTHSTITILSGGQDDHGGAGVGEFRTVAATAGEWTGGGNTAGGPHIYDRMDIN